MQTLDAQTLIVVLLLNMAALAVAIPAIMSGRPLSRAARCAQGSLVLQTLGWSCLALSRDGAPLDALLSVLAMAGLSSGTALLWESVRGWLGPRPGRRLMWSLAVALPLGYALSWGHYPLRVGWSNGLLALQLLLVCALVLRPTPDHGRGWRWLMAVSLGALALVSLWRGAMGAFFTADYPSFRTPHPAMLTFGLVANLAVPLNAVALLVAWREEAERALHRLARTDPLTGLLNRRALEQAAGALIAQARRHGDPLCLLLIDLDGFKAINDRHGHAAGDRALRMVADALAGTLRPGDLAGRWGGEEFCVLLARSGAEAGTAFDARLRGAVTARSIESLPFPLDFSTGLSVLEDEEDITADDLELMLQRADAALYRAKDGGRGRLARGVTADPAPGGDAPPPEDEGGADADGQRPRQPA